MSIGRISDVETASNNHHSRILGAEATTSSSNPNVLQLTRTIQTLLDHPENITLEALETCSDDAQQIHSILAWGIGKKHPQLGSKLTKSDYLYLLQMYNVWQGLLELKYLYVEGCGYNSELFELVDMAKQQIEESDSMTSMMIKIQRERLAKEKPEDHSKRRLEIDVTKFRDLILNLFSPHQTKTFVSIDGLVRDHSPDMVNIATLKTLVYERSTNRVQRTSLNITYPNGTEKVFQAFVQHLLRTYPQPT